MGEKNTLLGIGVFLFAALTMTFGSIAFYYKLEAEALQERIRIEEDKKKKVLFRIEDPNAGIITEKGKVDEEIEKVKKAIEDPTEGLLTMVKDTKAAAEKAYGEAERAHGTRQDADKKRKDSTEKAVNELGSAFGDMVKALAKLKEELEGHEKDLEKIQAELLSTMAAGRSKTDESREKIMKIRAHVATLESKLERMTERRKRLEELHKDGQVLSSDPKTNLAVVNLGKRHGVRPGMVFDIFEVKRDGKKVRKGKLRLRKVEAQQSFAVVLAACEAPKVCPQCGWSTTDITHLFCPFCLGGEDDKEREAQRLAEGSTKDRIVATEFLNPVKKGDHISSPFYLGRLKKKAFSFAVIGRTVDRSRQEIAMFLKENGCSLVASVTLDTDFAIVGTGTNVGQEIEKARKMGVSVIRESELFDFFGKAGLSPDALPEGEEL
jgi:hypothetical protein